MQPDNRLYKLIRVAVIHFCASDHCIDCYNLKSNDCDQALSYLSEMYMNAIKYEEIEKC